MSFWTEDKVYVEPRISVKVTKNLLQVQRVLLKGLIAINFTETPLYSYNRIQCRAHSSSTLEFVQRPNGMRILFYKEHFIYWFIRPSFKNGLSFPIFRLECCLNFHILKLTIFYGNFAVYLSSPIIRLIWWTVWPPRLFLTQLDPASY